MTVKYVFYNQLEVDIPSPFSSSKMFFAVVSNFKHKEDISDFLDTCKHCGVATIYTPGFATASFPDEKTFMWFKLKWG